MNILFIDLETTGQDASKHAIVQIAAEFHQNGQKVSSFSKNIKPGNTKDINLGALKYNKLTVKKIEAGDDASQVAREFADYVLTTTKNAKGAIYIGGHNVGFDLGFVEQLLKSEGITGLGELFSYTRLDTATIARFLNTIGVINSDKLRLEDLVVLLGIEYDKPKENTDVLDQVGKSYNDASYDVAITARVFYALQAHTKSKLTSAPTLSVPGGLFINRG